MVYRPQLAQALRNLWVTTRASPQDWSSALDLFHDFHERMVLGKGKQCVDVIFRTADDDRGAVPFAEDTVLARVERIAMFFRDPVLTVLRTVDEMK